MKKIELTIPKPCHEDWNAMTPKDRGRFCASCQKTVIDFSQMSDAQIAMFFKKPAGSVCGHFSNSQLNRVIDVPRKRIPWIRYFFTIALPAFLFSLKAGAQGEVRLRGRVAVKTQPEKKDQCETPAEKPPVNEVTGRIVNQKGSPIPGVSIFVEHTTFGSITDADGRFKLVDRGFGGKNISISAVGYISQRVMYDQLLAGETITLNLSEASMGEYIITVGMVAPKKVKTIPLLQPKNSDTAFSRFAVYPNPVSAGASVIIEPKKMEPGSYVIQLINSAGEIVQSNEVVFAKNNPRLSVSILPLAAGPHFLRLTNRKSNKSFTEVIVVN